MKTIKQHTHYEDGTLLEYMPNTNLMGSMSDSMYYYNTKYTFLVIGSRNATYGGSRIYKVYCFEYNLIEEVTHGYALKILG